MMHWVWTILIGFVVGALARLIVPGGGPTSFWMTALLGIVGAVAATLGGQALGWYAQGHPAGFVASLLGAVVVLILYKMVMREE
jgi:uncharacterized membrane protein YeaQ/YmgE (transglycosylase-associated protein family)